MSHYLKKQQLVLDRVLAGKAQHAGISRGGLSEASMMQLKASGVHAKPKAEAARGKKK